MCIRDSINAEYGNQSCLTMVLGAGRTPPASPKMTPRVAFLMGDPALSKQLHQNQVVEPGHDDRYGRACKTSFVMAGFGGTLLSHLLLYLLPGTFAQVASRASALAIACGIGLAVLCFIQKRSYKLLYDHERSREQWEMENFPDGERKEMTELFEAQGLSPEDAELAIATMSKEEYTPFFIDLMMMQEIGMSHPESEPSALQTACIVGATFICMALWPAFVGITLQLLEVFQEPVSRLNFCGMLLGSSTAILVVVHLAVSALPGGSTAWLTGLA
eukprot:TRINITY_DN14916_c0_g1_i2.p1 TRINITY_DN14916_c0_g1~~TRINITY_DN14916_c0_g1_i2.p1  ORF type:complete len:274 (-),score=53.70 TRINITY_DN14916_c0_g1_i2:389-1210(-)